MKQITEAVQTISTGTGTASITWTDRSEVVWGVLTVGTGVSDFDAAIEASFDGGTTFVTISAALSNKVAGDIVLFCLTNGGADESSSVTVLKPVPIFRVRATALTGGTVTLRTVRFLANRDGR